jgi:hypothetical protein
MGILCRHSVTFPSKYTRPDGATAFIVFPSYTYIIVMWGASVVEDETACEPRLTYDTNVITIEVLSNNNTFVVKLNA